MIGYRSDWLFPIDVAEFRISSPFGDRIHPITGDREFHNGIDVPAPEGTAILAPFAGTIRTWDHPRGGKSVSVTSADGFRVGIAHLQDWTIRVGTVDQGALIGFVGSSGLSTGPHIHLTTRPDPGDWEDPASVFIPAGADRPPNTPANWNAANTPQASIAGEPAGGGILAALLAFGAWLFLR